MTPVRVLATLDALVIGVVKLPILPLTAIELAPVAEAVNVMLLPDPGFVWL